ncbi:MAG: hypothetical protein MUE40_08020 [Anaerolineae bacterium]|nr:hypothetical protein [Anaerolineae bacterium]
MNFLKKLFGLGSGGQRADNGLYVYVRPKMCQEVLRLRVDVYNHLSLNDDESGYLVRKEARGSRCPFPVTVTLRFDRQRNLTGREIENGEFVTEADYAAVMQPAPADQDQDSSAGASSR